jgi:hypothetical protein
MRPIERVITGILLAAAVCGSAVFARSVGREAVAGSGDVQLTAAPQQHARSPRGVQVPLYPLLAPKGVASHRIESPAKPVTRPTLAHTPVLRISPVAPAPQVVAAPVVRRPVPTATRPKPVVQKPAPASPAAPAAPPPPAPAPATPVQQPDSRILANAQLTPTPTWEHVKGSGHGRLKNHPDDDDNAAPVQQPGPPASPSNETITVVVVPPAPPPAPSYDNGNGHGHAYGRLKQSFNDHD